jgi:hypothetical protein
MFSKLAYSVFEQSIKDYHQFDNVDQPINNFPKDKLNICYTTKNWIDTFNGILRTLFGIQILTLLSFNLEKKNRCF